MEVWLFLFYRFGTWDWQWLNVDFPAGYLPSYCCMFSPYSSCSQTLLCITRSPLRRLLSMQMPEGPSQCRGLGGTQTLDFHQVITPGDPAARGIRTDLEKFCPGSVRPYPVVGSDAPPGFSEGLWFSSVSRSQALGPGWERWQREHEHGRRELGAHREKSLSCLAVRVLSAASWRVPSPCLGFE